MRNKICHIFTVGMTPYLFFIPILEKLQELGYNNKVYCGKDIFSKKLKEHFSDNKVEIIETSFQRKINPIIFLKSFIDIYSIFRNEKSSTIIVHTPISSFICALVSLIIKPFNIIFYCHGLVSINHNSNFSRFVYWAEKFIFSRIDSAIFVSKSLADSAIKNNYVSPQKILMVTNSVSGVPPCKKLSTGKISFPIKIGYFGRISESKGAFDLFEISRILKLRGIEHQIIFAGTIEDEKTFNTLIQDNYQIKYIGFIENKDLFFSMIDLLIVPSRREGFGMSALESNARGIPVLGYKIIGLSDAIEDGISGILVNPFNINLLVDAIFNYCTTPASYFSHCENSYARAHSIFDQDLIVTNQCRKIKDYINRHH